MSQAGANPLSQGKGRRQEGRTGCCLAEAGGCGELASLSLSLKQKSPDMGQLAAEHPPQACLYYIPFCNRKGLWGSPSLPDQWLYQTR